MLSKEETEKMLDCSKCKLKECIGCEITYTDRKKIKEYIEQLESDNYECNNIINDYIDKRRELINKLEADKMEQFDDYVIYLIESYLAILKGEKEV